MGSDLISPFLNSLRRGLNDHRAGFLTVLFPGFLFRVPEDVRRLLTHDIKAERLVGSEHSLRRTGPERIRKATGYDPVQSIHIGGLVKLLEFLAVFSDHCRARLSGGGGEAGSAVL
jgi:hypothetical protein